MPDDLAEISQQAAQQIVPQAYTGPYQRDQHELILRQTDRAAKIIQAAIEAAIRAHRQQVAALAAELRGKADVHLASDGSNVDAAKAPTYLYAADRLESLGANQ
jgi:hypothetical protein